MGYCSSSLVLSGSGTYHRVLKVYLEISMRNLISECDGHDLWDIDLTDVSNIPVSGAEKLFHVCY